MSMNESDFQRFWNYIEKTSGCWFWTGPIENSYGIIKIKKKRMLADRLSYERAYRPIPDGLHIDHICGVTRCVKPSHLEAVPLRSIKIEKGLDKEDLAIRAAKHAERHRFRKSFFE